MINLLQSIEDKFDENKPLIIELFGDKETLEILEENIPLSLYRSWVKKLKELGVNHKERYQKIFGNDENGKPRMRIYIPLGGTVHKAGEAHPRIKKILEANGFEIVDWVKGKCKKTGSKELKSVDQYPNIGSTLTQIFQKLKKEGKEEEAKSAYYAERIWKDEAQKNKEVSKGGGEETEEEKKAKKSAGYVVISRHPYDIMGISGDRHWASCQSVIDKYEQPAKGAYASSGAGKRPQKDVERINIPPGMAKKDMYVRDEKGEIKKDKEGKAMLKPGVERVKTKMSDFTPEMVNQNFAHGRKGMHYMGVQGDLRWGAIVAYWVDSDDLNINNPRERLIIKPYYRSDGEVFLYPDPRSYGKEAGASGAKESPTPAFKSTVQKWLNHHQTAAKGVYHIKSYSYGSPWSGHYPEREEEATPSSPAQNATHVKEFRDGLKWEDVQDVYSDFSMAKFRNAVIGERGDKLVFYSGRFLDGTFSGIFLGGTFEGGNFEKGFFGAESGGEKTVKEATDDDDDENENYPIFVDGTATAGTFRNCIIRNMKTVMRVTFGDNVKVTERLTITGGIISKNTKTNYIHSLVYGNYQHPSKIDWTNWKFDSISQNQTAMPENVEIFYTNCKLQNATLSGTITDCTLAGNIRLTPRATLVGLKTKYENISMSGGVFQQGTVTSGSMVNVTCKKIIVHGPVKMKNCVIEHGIINGGILQDCKFLAGRFLKGRWFGGEFLGGTFEGGDFSDGKFGDKAVWKGGRWHGGEGKPQMGIQTDQPNKKELAKAHKELELKKRFLAKGGRE